MYPDCKKMVAYGEFRAPYEGDKSDTRFIYYGIQYLLDNFINVRWTEQDVERADLFYKTHNAGFTPYPYPKVLVHLFSANNWASSLFTRVPITSASRFLRFSFYHIILITLITHSPP